MGCNNAKHVWCVHCIYYSVPAIHCMDTTATQRNFGEIKRTGHQILPLNLKCMPLLLLTATGDLFCSHRNIRMDASVLLFICWAQSKVDCGLVTRFKFGGMMIRGMMNELRDRENGRGICRYVEQKKLLRIWDRARTTKANVFLVIAARVTASLWEHG